MENPATVEKEIETTPEGTVEDTVDADAAAAAVIDAEARPVEDDADAAAAAVIDAEARPVEDDADVAAAAAGVIDAEARPVEDDAAAAAANNAAFRKRGHKNGTRDQRGKLIIQKKLAGSGSLSFWSLNFWSLSFWSLSFDLAFEGQTHLLA